MSDKENDEFSSAMLLVAVAVYVAVVSALFAGMMVAKPTVGEGLATWAHDYGAIIAGVPVLVAVLLAKQQLDANRRQHAAQLYEGKLQELDALEGIVVYCDQIDLERPGAFRTGRDVSTPVPNLTYRVSMFVPFSMSSAFSRLCDQVDNYNQTDRVALKMYGGDETSDTEHRDRCWGLFGAASVLRQSALDRIAQIQSLAPSTHSRPLTRSR